MNESLFTPSTENLPPGVACGHGAIAAACGVPIVTILDQLPPDGWVNYPMMLAALQSIETLRELRTDKGRRFPLGMEKGLRGVALIQWEGPWCEAKRPPAARCKYRHWVALRTGRIWDINWPGEWVDPAHWADEMAPELYPKRATGWSVFRTLYFRLP